MSQPGPEPSDYTPNPAYPVAPPPPTAGAPYPHSPAAWPQPYSPGPYPPAMQPALVRPTSGMATASLVFGIAGIFLFCLIIPSLVAVLCGHSAIKATRGGHLGGHGQAVAGLILGYVVMIPAAIWLAFGGIGMLMTAFEGG